MALLRRNSTDTRTTSEERGARPGGLRGLIRGLFTLAGVAAAGLLVWIASTFALESSGEFWAAMALIAAGGLVLGLSQLFGGWTKWGWPTVSPGVFLLGFLPTFVMGAWILLATQPAGGWQQGRFESWSDRIGVLGFVSDIALFPAVVAFTIGLVFAFVFDTSGPRTRVVTHDSVLADEDVQDYRPRRTSAPGTAGERTVAEDVRLRDERIGVTSAGGHVDGVETSDPSRRTDV